MKEFPKNNVYEKKTSDFLTHSYWGIAESLNLNSLNFWFYMKHFFWEFLSLSGFHVSKWLITPNHLHAALLISFIIKFRLSSPSNVTTVIQKAIRLILRSMVPRNGGSHRLCHVEWNSTKLIWQSTLVRWVFCFNCWFSYWKVPLKIVYFIKMRCLTFHSPFSSNISCFHYLQCMRLNLIHNVLDSWNRMYFWLACVNHKLCWETWSFRFWFQLSTSYVNIIWLLFLLHRHFYFQSDNKNENAKKR